MINAVSVITPIILIFFIYMFLYFWFMFDCIDQQCCPYYCYCTAYNYVHLVTLTVFLNSHLSLLGFDVMC